MEQAVKPGNGKFNEHGRGSRQLEDDFEGPNDQGAIMISLVEWSLSYPPRRRIKDGRTAHAWNEAVGVENKLAGWGDGGRRIEEPDGLER